MRLMLICTAVFSVFYYLVLTALDWLQIVVPERWPSAVLAGTCAALVYWAVPKLVARLAHSTGYTDMAGRS